MTNKLVVIINSLKVPKIKKILLYEMKFLVPNYSYLQIRGLPPPDPRSLCPQLNLLNPPRKKFLGTPLPLPKLHDHTQTHHTLQESFRRVISPTQRPLPDNIDSMQTAEFELIIRARGQPQTHALDRGISDFLYYNFQILRQLPGSKTIPMRQAMKYFSC